MPKFRVVTPKGASFTVAGGGYDYEKEALDPIGAEIIEAPANEAEFAAAASAISSFGTEARPVTVSASTVKTTAARLRSR